MRLSRPVILVCLVLGALVATAPAGAATPCWRQVINDWYKDGKVDGKYPIHCYSEAIANLPADSKEYSSAPQDIRRDMLLAIRGDQSTGGPTSGGSSSPSSPSNNTGGGTGTKTTTHPAIGATDRRFPSAVATGFGAPLEASSATGAKSSKGFIDRVLNSFGPKNASSVPLPLIILAAVALLLLAAGAISFAARRVQARRIPPPRP
jgi:hypothetical protein